MPTSIIFDYDLTFTNKFWKEIFNLQGTHLKMSTPYHPQIDGQTKVVNKWLEIYLRCFASKKQDQWTQWLPLVE